MALALGCGLLGLVAEVARLQNDDEEFPHVSDDAPGGSVSGAPEHPAESPAEGGHQDEARPAAAPAGPQAEPPAVKPPPEGEPPAVGPPPQGEPAVAAPAPAPAREAPPAPEAPGEPPPPAPEAPAQERPGVIQLPGGGLVEQCALEGPGAVCECRGKVKLGAHMLWSDWKVVSGKVECSTAVFGDPAPGLPKACFCLALAAGVAKTLEPAPLLKPGSKAPPLAPQLPDDPGHVAFMTGEGTVESLVVEYLEVVAGAGPGSRPRVLCALRASGLDGVGLAARETWGARCDALVVYTSREGGGAGVVQIRRYAGGPVRVDRALEMSVYDDTRSEDVTEGVNGLIAGNGISDLTGGEPLFRKLPDHFQNKPKKLVVQKGGRTLTLKEGSGNVYDLTPLLGPAGGASAVLPPRRDCWLHLYHNYLLDYDYFLLAEEGTYLVVDNLRHLLREPRVAEPHSAGLPLYLGRPAWLPWPRAANLAGAGVVLNRRALHQLGCEYGEGRCGDDAGGSADAEDAALGRCLSALGVSPLITWDEWGRDLFHPFSPDRHVTMNMTHMAVATPDDRYLVGSMHATVGFECCSQRSVSFGGLAEPAMRALHRGLYGTDELPGPPSLAWAPKSFLGRFGDALTPQADR